MSKVLSFRVSDEEAAWADEYAKARGVSRQDFLYGGFASFREDCESGVPDIRARVREVVRGVGDCPKSEGGHVWAHPRIDPLRSCVHCGKHGREPAVQGEDGGGHLAEATLARAEVFSGLRAPMANGSGDPGKAWPRGRPPEVAGNLARVRAEVARDDRERPWHGEGAGRRRMSPEEAAEHDAALAAKGGKS